jgi:hypothetical protein
VKDLLSKLFGPDPDLLNAYRSVIPDTIRIHQDKQHGTIVIRVTQINDDVLGDETLLITEAKKESDIVPAVNDLIMTYFDIPAGLRRYYEKGLVLQGQLNKNAVLKKA